MLARILALVFVFATLLAPTSVFAESAISPLPTTNPLQTTTSLPSYIPPTSPMYTDLLVNNLFHSFSCLAIGQSIIGQPCLSYHVTKNAQGILQSIPVLSQANLSGGGTLGVVTSIIGTLYLNPPVRPSTYLASVGKDFGIVKEAHAQVVGSSAGVLDPILKLWQISRNISYVIMIIVFLVIGIMIMFRNKINPQTVITAQAAIPGLIIGLILITFSYFIASLITDVAFLGINLVGYYFTAAQGKTATDLVSSISSENILTIFSNFIGVISSGDIAYAIEIIFNRVGPEVQNFLRFAAGVMAFQTGNQIGHVVPVVGDLAGIVSGVVISLITAAFVPQILGLVLSWVSMVVLIYSMLKVLLRLITNYLNIVFLTITAPFQFMAASMPGRQSIATGWALNILCNALAFPAVMAVFYFVAYLLGLDRSPFNVTGQVGIIGGSTLPLLGGLDMRFINILLAFGALTALPAIPEIICRSLGRTSAAGQLLGQELSGNVRGGRGYSNQWQQAGQNISTMGQGLQTFRGRPITYSPAGQLESSGIGPWGWGKGIKIPGLGKRS